jgi:hypothetical protein
MEEPVLVPLILLVLSSIGFTGLSDSAANTNWPFYAVISLDFAYHFRRMLVFLSSFYGIVLLQYTIIVTHINILLSLPYLFSVVSIMLFTIGIACSKGSTIKKTALCGLYILPAVRILYSNPYIMAAGILPPVIVLLAAKHNFAEWGYL